MLDDERDGAHVDLNHAAQDANADCDTVPHSANGGSGDATILGPQRRNRRWDRREKARITAESFEHGACISAVARRHGVSLGLLHYWRRTLRDRGALDAVTMVPIEVDDEPVAARSDLEIEIGGARVLVRGRVDGSLLRTVLARIIHPIEFRTAGLGDFAGAGHAGSSPARGRILCGSRFAG